MVFKNNKSYILTKSYEIKFWSIESEYGNEHFQLVYWQRYIIKGKDHIVKIKMESYLNKYIKAHNNQRILRNKMFCSFSTLQYFHKELGIEEL